MSTNGNHGGPSLRDPQRRPLFWVFVATAAGCVLSRGHVFEPPVCCRVELILAAWTLTVVGAVGLWWVIWRRRPSRLSGMVLLVATALMALLWHHDRWQLYRRDELGLWAPAEPVPVCLEGVLTSTPRRLPLEKDTLGHAPPRDLSTFRFRATRVRDGATWRDSSGQAQVLVPGVPPKLTSGDYVRLYGLVSKIAPPLNPGEFDFALAARAERRLTRLVAPAAACVTRLRPASWLSAPNLLQGCRDAGNAALARHVSPEHTALASAILLGIREPVDRQLIDDFMATGTVHLLSISGLHVGMLALGFWWLAAVLPLPRRGSLIAAIALSILYAALTDAQPPVVRAAVLIVVVCCARLLGRRPIDLNTLSLAGLIVAISNPATLFQTGTQLSFLAVATLIRWPTLGPGSDQDLDPLDRLIAQTRPWPQRWLRTWRRYLASMLRTSAAIWLTTAPLVMVRFHLVSPIAIVLNLFIWLPMIGALLTGFGVLLTSGLLPPLASVLGWLCGANLAAIERIVAGGLLVPGGYAWVPAPPAWWLWVIHLGVAVVLFGQRLPLRPRWLWTLTSCWLAFGYFLTAGPGGRPRLIEPDELRATFIAVGHGASVLIELPDGRVILYDAGRMGTPRNAAAPIAAVLWSRGLTHLDAVVISHADADHYNALPVLLDRFSVGVVYTSPATLARDSDAIRALLAQIHAAGVPVRPLVRGDRLLACDGCRLDVLWPPPQGIFGTDNENSIVLAVRQRGRVMLLPGDLEGRGLASLLDTPPTAAELVMAPHHGSLGSDPAGIRDWSNPQFVVISGTAGETAGAAMAQYGRAGATVLHTAIDGALQVVWRPSGQQVTTFRASTNAP